MSTVLSVRVKRELKEEAERLGLDLRAVIEKALREEIAKARVERFRKLLEDGLSSMKLRPEDWVEAVKGSRQER